MRILVIEDDPTLNKNIREALLAEGMKVESAYDGLLSERILRKHSFDCVVMDINLPGKSGFDLCRDFRKFDTATPVLMLTAFGDLEDKVKGFDQGADDYLTKPFFMRELILRVQVLVKRHRITHTGTPGSDNIHVDDITIHTGQKKVIRQGQEIPLTPREYQILLKLSENKGEIVAKDELIKEIWGSSLDFNTNTVEVFINFLRSKLDKPFGKKTIKTKVGFGYYLDTE